MDTHPRNRHERRRQQTRQLLIQTTLQLVLEKGYEAVLIQDITDRADLGRGTFYIHFKDKEEVLWTAIQSMILAVEDEAHRQYRDNVPDQVEYYGLLRIFRHAGENRDLYRVVFGGQGPTRLTGRVKDLLAKVFLYDVQNRPNLSQPDRDAPDEFIAQMMTGLLMHLISWWLSAPNNYSAEQMAAFTYKALYHRNPPAGTPQKRET